MDGFLRGYLLGIAVAAGCLLAKKLLEAESKIRNLEYLKDSHDKRLLFLEGKVGGKAPEEMTPIKVVVVGSEV